MFNKCIISHSSTKSLVPPLPKFAIQKLDLFLFPFSEKVDLFNIALYLLTCQYFGGIEKHLSCRNVELHFADFS